MHQLTTSIYFGLGILRCPYFYWAKIIFPLNVRYQIRRISKNYYLHKSGFIHSHLTPCCVGNIWVAPCKLPLGNAAPTYFFLILGLGGWERHNWLWTCYIITLNFPSIEKRSFCEGDNIKLSLTRQLYLWGEWRLRTLTITGYPIPRL